MHFVYVYLNPLKPGKFCYGTYQFDYEPFYVGKGTRYRHLIHDKLFKSGKLDRLKNTQKHDTIKKSMTQD